MRFSEEERQCTKCNRIRSIDLFRHRSVCKVCDAYRLHIKKVDPPKSYDLYESYYLENKERREAKEKGFKVCSFCKKKEVLSKGEDWLNKSGQCNECRILSKRAQRLGISLSDFIKKYGRNYKRKPKGKGPKGKVKGSLPPTERVLRLLSEKNARQAWDWWVKVKAPDSWVEVYYGTEPNKPWHNQRLSVSESFNLRYRLDPDFNVRRKIARQMRKKAPGGRLTCLMLGAIARNGDSPSIQKLLGYSIEDLKNHLESGFKDGMSWDAFLDGYIHIDHVIPQAMFNLDDSKQFLECWSLNNLQPLWAKDNLAKGSKVPIAKLIEWML